MGCPFLLTAKCTNIGWKVTMNNNNHNHGVSRSVLAHPIARKRSEQDVEAVLGFTKTNALPSQIAGTLRESDKLITAKDVSNMKGAERKKALRGRTPIQALLHYLLDNEEWTAHHDVDDDSNITKLFFFYKPSRDMALRYRYVFVMDCTYKTNR